MKTVGHSIWTPPVHMRVAATVSAAASRLPRKPTGGSRLAASFVPSSSSAPRGHLVSFFGKAQSAIMKAISFSCQQNHDVQKRLIISKNQLMQRLCDRGSPVSDE